MLFTVKFYSMASSLSSNLRENNNNNNNDTTVESSKVFGQSNACSVLQRE